MTIIGLLQDNLKNLSSRNLFKRSELVVYNLRNYFTQAAHTILQSNIGRKFSNHIFQVLKMFGLK